MSTRRALALVVCAIVFVTIPAQGKDVVTTTPKCSRSIGDIVSLLGSNYTVLSELIRQADLYDELTIVQGLFELNVSVAMLNRPALNAALQSIVSYHVAVGNYKTLGIDLADPESSEVDMSDNLILSQYAYLAAFPYEDSEDGDMFSLVSDNDALLVMSDPLFVDEQCNVVVYELLGGLLVPRQAFGELGAWGSTVAG